ncbi:5-methylcytosine restriction system specificity protein McrC [Brevibacillus reuszeri]|uniref:5-methylcytosine restriction system specificity protein McrC n=1 Tax=Brevibacillus reuszeri TaxID=54915 RepID=UPI000CCC3224|nr:restriction endonuclease [Brevibacillus reuszeri]
MSKQIPIQNIYYMLCYCYDVLPEKEAVDVAGIDTNDLLELFANSLVKKLNRFIKKGFYKEYISFQENTSSLKGKLMFDESIKQITFLKAKMYCDYDDFSPDILHNRIIKATIHRLIKSKSIMRKTRDDLNKIYRYFHEIELVRLDRRLFNQTLLHRNNHHYGIVLSICRVLFDHLLVDETTGELIFDDFERDERKMWELFEGFVRNFYSEELKPGYRVKRETIQWDIQQVIRGSENYIPGMHTDICIVSKKKKIIIDTKYHKEVFSKGKNGEDKIKPANLYQMFAYLSNAGRKEEMEGILLYPQSDKQVDLAYRINEYTIKCATVNLNQHWTGIRERLLNMID